ncbi:MAG: hypothetical protein M1835_002570 [Candelina submexicana]|nr:MAG: hypothetical protein M1835_002570 [Candelina submexicana]
MPAVITGIGAPVPHIPAWKKLGLKLKFAKDEAPKDPKPSVSTTPIPSERKLSSDNSIVPDKLAFQHSSTKAIVSKPRSSLEVKNSTLSNASRAQTQFNDPSKSSRPSQSTPQIRRQKSVTFTSETKAEDGHSVKQLFATWLADHKAQDPKFNAEKAGEAFHVITPQTDLTIESRDKAKVSKKRAKESERKISDSLHSRTSKTPQLPSALQYLQQYHTSRENWKFNKVRQSHILKHLFNTDKIPTSYDAALSAYIAGIQGQAALNRVRKTAEQVRLADEEDEPSTDEDMESYARVKEDYDNALKHFITRLKNQLDPTEEEDFKAEERWRKKLMKRKRAEMILWELGDRGQQCPTDTVINNNRRGLIGGPAQSRSQGTHVFFGEEEDAVDGMGAERSKRTKLNDGSSTHKNVRRRKRRTGVPDDDDSSSSESSSLSGSTPSTGSSSRSGDSNSSESSSSSSESSSSASDPESSSSSESESGSSSGSGSDSDDGSSDNGSTSASSSSAE